MNEMIVVPRVGFIEAVKNAFKNYANFKGRIRRSEYWFFILFVSIPATIVLILMGFTIEEHVDSEGYIYYTFPRSVQLIILVVFLGFISPVLSSTIRRLHDSGKNGYYILVTFIPFCGTLILIIFLCDDSQKETNEFGPSTKYLLGDESNEPINHNGINDENDGEQPNIIPDDYSINNQSPSIPQQFDENEQNVQNNQQNVIIPSDNANNPNEKFFQIQPEIIPQI